MASNLRLTAIVVSLPLLLLCVPAAQAQTFDVPDCQRYSRGEEPPFSRCDGSVAAPADEADDQCITALYPPVPAPIATGQDAREDCITQVY